MGRRSELDEEQFRDFVTAKWDSLLRTAYLLTGDNGAAEDLVQSALAQTSRHWRRIERTDAPEVYVRKVMVNLHASWWRRPRVREQLTDSVPEARRTHVEDAHRRLDERDELWQALLTLPPRMRAVLVLRYFEDLPEAEVARVMGCSLGTVKSQASRGLDRMRDAFAPPPASSELTDTTLRSRA